VASLKLKRGLVVAIGVDRHRVGRDNSTRWLLPFSGSRRLLGTSPRRSSEKFELLLTVAVMFADDPLVVLIRHDVRVRKLRRAPHDPLVHP
jgi:hypothetical protein